MVLYCAARDFRCVGTGISFSEAREMIRKAKAGDVQTALVIAETIGFQVHMDAQPTEAGKHCADGDERNDDFDFM